MDNNKIDWKLCASVLARKLQALSARLNDECSSSTSLDVVNVVRSIMDEFGLSSDEPCKFVDYLSLRSQLDSLTGMYARLRFATFAERPHLEAAIAKKLSDFSFDFDLFGAFQSVPGEVNHG